MPKYCLQVQESNEKLKQKEGSQGSKRWKGWVQHKLAKRKKCSESSASQIQEPMVFLNFLVLF
jgi:hypothetical protein